MLALTAAPPPHNNPPSTCQAIALLPFIDAARLRAALAPLRSHLADGEKLRDAHGDNLLFAACHPPSAAEPPSVGLGRSVAKACPCAPRGAPTTNASTIVLAGGGTAVRGFGRRIQRELSGGKKIVLADNEARRDLVWHGATRLARNFTYHPKLLLRRRRPSQPLDNRNVGGWSTKTGGLDARYV